MAKRKNRARRVDFSTYKPIHNRGFNPAYMEEIQDSLIARNYAEPQRVAILSNILHETGGDPTLIGPGGFRGIVQWGDDRYPNTEKLNEQITELLNTSENVKTPNWSDGGGGNPIINTAKEAYNTFWNSKDPYEATLYYTKGYVRPKDYKARTNRAKEATNMARNLFDNGGYVYNPNYGLSSLNSIPLLGGMSAARIGQPIFDYNLEKISNVPIIDITNNSNISNYFKDPTSIARPTYRTSNSTLPNKIDVKVGEHSLANDGPLTNQQLGIKPKTDWNSVASKGMAGLSGAMGIVQAYSNNAQVEDTTGLQNTIDMVANTTFDGGSNEALLAQWQANSNPIDRVSQKDLTGSTGEKLLNTGSAIAQGAMSGASIGGPVGAIIGGAAGAIGGIAGWIRGDKKAEEEAQRLNQEALLAEQRRQSNFNLSVDNLAAYNSMLAKANYAKYGGPLFNEFSNGVTLINEGGTHEENPNEGVPMGLDYEGIPNLVEEGEVVFNDYVFSNRLIVPDKVRAKYKLRDTKDLSFADAAKDIQKMSEEMPNDPIVKRTMETRLNDLINEQEMVRAKKNKKNKGNRYDWGSYLQYAPVALSSALALKDAFSGYDVDYSLFNPYKQAINNANVRVSTKPVTTNIKYKPFDTRTPLNELAASKAATTRAIMNTSGGNPAVARALLTSADYNYNNQLGQLWRSVEEAEYNRRLGFEQFKTGLEANNRARELQAASTNTEILRSQAGLWGDYTNRLYNAERAQEAAYSSNLSSAIADLSNLGRQQDYASWIAKLQEAGIITDDEGKMAFKLRANGGKIKRKRRLS